MVRSLVLDNAWLADTAMALTVGDGVTYKGWAIANTDIIELTSLEKMQAIIV